eukprot:TRINITY_DN26864_c0_g1_i1.p1 TRINITY_DN26864_c0_g1~~TRINITY_DN26864_c0_g1_i1.p1  ORF type:complete len:456 (-),score=88.71 TRINITY_DN26864_c0_g1_i1:195-1562(-)
MEDGSESALDQLPPDEGPLGFEHPILQSLHEEKLEHERLRQALVQSVQRQAEMTAAEDTGSAPPQADDASTSRHRPRPLLLDAVIEVMTELIEQGQHQFSMKELASHISKKNMRGVGSPYFTLASAISKHISLAGPHSLIERRKCGRYCLRADPNKHVEVPKAKPAKSSAGRRPLTALAASAAGSSGHAHCRPCSRRAGQPAPELSQPDIADPVPPINLSDSAIVGPPSSASPTSRPPASDSVASVTASLLTTAREVFASEFPQSAIAGQPLPLMSPIRTPRDLPPGFHFPGLLTPSVSMMDGCTDPDPVSALPIEADATEPPADAVMPSADVEPVMSLDHDGEQTSVELLVTRELVEASLDSDLPEEAIPSDSDWRVPTDKADVSTFADAVSWVRSEARQRGLEALRGPEISQAILDAEFPNLRSSFISPASVIRFVCRCILVQASVSPDSVPL